ncbi:MAG: metallophosphatase, partial [Firmicutes bacterium]|nr:metallophosphatase [Bacillota bacterium]
MSSSSSSSSSSNSFSSSSSSSAWPSEPIHEITSLDFYALNDFHGAVEYKPDTTYPEVGITRLATYFDQREAANPEGTVLLAAGDMFQGSADSNITYGKVVVDSMNAMNFDAMEIGNHEFDWTDSYIYENQQRANFPFLGANIIDKTTGKIAAFAEPYTMIERQGVRIGIIGIIGDTLESSILPSAIVNYDFQAGAAFVVSSAAALRSEGADIVIVLDHNGSIDNSVLPYVDAVFLGHTHSYGNTVTNGVPLMQAYCNGEAVSHVTLSYNKTSDTVTLGTHEVVQGIADLGLNEAADVKAVVDSYADVINPIKNEVVGTLT